MEKTVEQRLDSLKNLVAIQCADGNWNCNPYMMGMANGLLIALSCFTGESPDFKQQPEGGWLSDKIDWKALDASHAEGLASGSAIPAEEAFAQLRASIAQRATKGSAE